MLGDSTWGISRPAVTRLSIPLCCTLAVIAAIEAITALTFAPHFWQRSGWLLHDPYLPETLDRILAYEKLKQLDALDPDIISVGDSSGLFSVQATIVNRYTHGRRFLNLSTGANHAFAGYKAIAEHMLQRSPRLKHVVLHMYPTIVPSDAVIQVADLGRILHEDLLGPRSYLMPPTAALSPTAKLALFQHKKYSEDAPLTTHKWGVEVSSTAGQSLGWLPEHDTRFNRVVGWVAFAPDARTAWYHRLGVTERSSINAVLDDFHRMVRRYGAELVVFFSPVPARAILQTDANLPVAEAALERFQNEHPDVAILTPLVTDFGGEKFGEWNHVSREYTFVSSARLGRSLEKLILDRGSVPKFKRSFQHTDNRPPISWRAVGPPTPEGLAAAMAFYLYAATADETYTRLLSRRVLDLIAKEPAFGFMMQDTRDRIAMLAHKNTTLGYDVTGLTGTPVEPSGMTHCNPSPDVRWIHVAGTIRFTYQSPIIVTEAPVPWAATSGILIPTVMEDGLLKFDGYCPEPLP